MRPFLLHAPCKDYLWGGNRLRDYGKTSAADRIAESWELSCHPDGESVIASGEYEGMTLSAFLQEHPEALGANCRRSDRFPVLVKLIDAQENLSVQVHPDDTYARTHGGQGKTEMWYVIDAAPGAEMLCGVEKPMTRAELRQSIADHTILDKLRHVPVKTGDVVFLPAGTLHAIGKGCLIAEIQQNSNTTYRVYDYGRGRELHIEQAVEAARLTPEYGFVRHVSYGKWAQVGACDWFWTNRIWLHENAPFCIEPGDAKDSTFSHLLCIGGSCTLTAEDTVLQLQPGTSVFLPADSTCRIEGACMVLCTGVPHDGWNAGGWFDEINCQIPHYAD